MCASNRSNSTSPPLMMSHGSAMSSATLLLLVHFLEPAAELTIRNEIILLRHPSNRPGHSTGPARFPVVYDPLESAIAAAYRATTYGDDTTAVHNFLAEHTLLAQTGDAEHLLDRLNKILFETINYNRRPEKGTQSPAQTLEMRSGSCRDLATLMMEACRSLGMAARFASGYLDCPASAAGDARLHACVGRSLPPFSWLARVRPHHRRTLLPQAHHLRPLQPSARGHAGLRRVLPDAHLRVPRAHRRRADRKGLTPAGCSFLL